MKKNKGTKKILVTSPYLPPQKEYLRYVNQIWKIRHLTNDGPLVRQLESKLRSYLGVKHVFFMSNGTIAIQIALKALSITGEVITTPFTYVATTTSIIWEHCKPVFVDIDKNTLCMDPEKIEAAITKKTRAILAVHVYGYPCNVRAIEKIARKHNLKLIYDAAHAFDTKIDSKSVLKYGDISTLSFHATKLFHTIEGGAIITNDDKVAKKIALYRSFGHIGDEHYIAGINGKNSEFHAAMGLANLPKVKSIIKKRKLISGIYDDFFKTKDIKRPISNLKISYNYAYYPVIFNTESELLRVKMELEAHNIFPRRYFYPSLNTLPYVTYKSCPVSESISKRVLCLPLYKTLNLRDVRHICDILDEVIPDRIQNISFYGIRSNKQFLQLKG